MSTVSVVLATCNGSRFLLDQLASLVAQTRVPDEVVVADDCSDDETLQVVESFRSRFEELNTRLRVIARPVRLGYGENFLQAAVEATGDFIAFCDQDDIWRADKLEAAVSELEHTRAVLHVHSAAVIDDGGQLIGHFDQGFHQRQVHNPGTLAPWGVYYGFSMTFSADLLRIARLARRGRHLFEYEGSLSHDLWIYFLASTFGDVVTDPRELASYRRHSSNETPSILRLGLRGAFHGLGWSVDLNHSRAEIARHRVRLLESIDAEPWASRARAAEPRWRRIANYEDRRIALYQARRPSQKIREFGGLALAGAYGRTRTGGLGPRLMIKDAVMGAIKYRGASEMPERVGSP